MFRERLGQSMVATVDRVVVPSSSWAPAYATDTRQHPSARPHQHHIAQYSCDESC
eukprot:CAMPEP_0118977258 /NCGR_PEP_ID=MMETSP1173-20130426/20924_1 /TAXON_ID=1034831 /ORGANISM="Rhizochromulina marina cf, Strain CCMP1243" /LENGTH=54 /DNA_ID=CAMNT_0006927343 /DNA_START=380 /DNA_END=541 /DNA_ORIENTATION=-